MTTGRINQVTIPTLGPSAKWPRKPVRQQTTFALSVQNLPSGRFRHQTIASSFFKETRRCQEKSIKIIWTNPHSHPSHGLEKLQCRKAKSATSRPSLIPPGTHNLGVGSPSQLRDWDHRPERETASELVERLSSS